MNQMCYNMIGNDVCERMKNISIEQSAAELLSGNSGEGSETTVSLNVKTYDNDPTAPNLDLNQ